MCPSHFAAGTISLLLLMVGAGNSGLWGGGTANVRAAAAPVLCAIPEPVLHDFGDVGVNGSLSWSFTLLNCGGGQLDWSIIGEAWWVRVRPSQGTTTTGKDKVTVCVNTRGLAPDQPHTGRINITSNGGALTGTVAVTPRAMAHLVEDIDRDGAIDRNDLNLLVDAMGRSALPEGHLDPSGDAIVDALDLALVAKRFQCH